MNSLRLRLWKKDNHELIDTIVNATGEKTVFVYNHDMKKDKKEALGNNLKILIEANKISQHHLAKKLNINQSTLHNYMNGVLPQGLVALIKISNFFQISIDDLIFGETSRGNVRGESFTCQERKYEIIIKKLP